MKTIICLYFEKVLHTRPTSGDQVAEVGTEDCLHGLSDRQNFPASAAAQNSGGRKYLQHLLELWQGLIYLPSEHEHSAFFRTEKASG